MISDSLRYDPFPYNGSAKTHAVSLRLNTPEVIVPGIDCRSGALRPRRRVQSHELG